MPAHVHNHPAPPAPVSGQILTRPYKAARLALSATLTDRVADLADREDLVVRVAPGVRDTYSAPALIHFPSATIHIDAGLFENGPNGATAPAPGDPHTRPVGFGALVHEAAHAAHTRWKTGIPTGIDNAALAAADLIEEIRAEAAQVNRRPVDRRWLRAMASELILEAAPASSDDSPWAAAQAALLVGGRVDNGTLTPTEAAPVMRAAEQVLGQDLLEELRAVWTFAAHLDDDDTDGMLAAGRAWCQLLNTDPEKPEPAPMQGPRPEGEPSGGILAQAVDTTAARVGRNTAAEAPAPLPSATEAANAEKKKQDRTRKLAAGIFDPNARPGRVTGTRPATGGEQRAAARLAEQLRRAAVRERAAVPTASQLPPGRLNVRAAMTRDAQRAAGAIPTAEPWRAVARKSTPTPPLRIGIVVDTSGSMRDFTAPVASIAWILARAAALSGTDAATATVHFDGATVAAITRPGHNPAQVPVFDTGGGGHPVGRAIDAVDGGLGLTKPGAARLLVIVSDGVFISDEQAAARDRIARLSQTGCAVLQITADGQNAVNVPGAARVTVPNAAAAGAVIGDAVVKALTTA